MTSIIRKLFFVIESKEDDENLPFSLEIDQRLSLALIVMEDEFSSASLSTDICISASCSMLCNQFVYIFKCGE